MSQEDDHAQQLAAALDARRSLKALTQQRQEGRPAEWYAARPDDQKFAGLRNEGATCYLNSLLQSLFALHDVRREIFAFAYHEERDGAAADCVPHQLSRLFARMQLSRQHALSTRPLTASFGWSQAESFRQHDVQELCRVLFDALERSGVPIGTRLFEGATSARKRCATCGYSWARTETFCDVQVDIGGPASCGCNPLPSADLAGALRQLVAWERMEGDNAVACDRCASRQPVDMGTSFERLPPLLMLQLKRFVFDFQAMSRKKLNHRLAFPLELDMAPYTSPLPLPGDVAAAAAAAAREPEWYDCVGALVHSGFAHLPHKGAPSYYGSTSLIWQVHSGSAHGGTFSESRTRHLLIPRAAC
jgi:ubiquitin C-terminal hydrolase